MEQDDPTVLDPGRSGPRIAAEPVEPVEPAEPAEPAEPLESAPAMATEPQVLDDMPTWPGLVTAEPPQSLRQWMQALVPRQPAPTGYVSALAFGISLGANVVLLAGLLGVLAVLLLGNAGAFAARGASGQAGPGGSVRGGALGRPTATATAIPSPTATTAPASWLQVTPSSVQLGCGDSQLAQIALQNNGPQTVDWQVVSSLPADQAGVAVAPQQGELGAGESMQILLQNTTQASGQQGVIDFAPTTPDAGPPAALSYTTVAC